MPGIGNPNAASNGQFGRVKINRGQNRRVNPNSLKQNKDALDENLNKLSGRKPESRFKDGAKHNQIGKDGFLKLLTHQLANQDPFSPMDQKQFAADMAQFAQVEQMTNMNKKMDGMTKNVPSENKFFGASFIGKKVLTKGMSLEYDGKGGNLNVPFSLKQVAKQSRIRIYDSHKQLIKEINTEGLPAGTNNILWDGLMNDGTLALKDNYRIEVDAWDQDFNQFKGETKASGVVTGVRFEGETTILELASGKTVFLRDVESFQTAEMTGSDKKMPGLKKTAKSAYNKNTSENSVH
ncbi:MAG: hypothetical protein HN509_18265 [Halobacteriovoraceae bacterium]|jgi:flagellar basal-body rod modification protein FlgD|nr:hypothetical protein [Halobacteriovoraceae bacterium]